MRQQVQAEIEIRNLQTIKELEEVRQLETIVWSFEDSIAVNQTITVVKNGGFILGAYIKNQLIGFQYSFPGFDGNKVYLCSHSLGIHPEYRKYGIGERLKWAQKALANEKGYVLITWTYDPLETVNGNLNLHKLGAICKTYMEDAYGEMDDGLNSGIATDRFLVEWPASLEKKAAERKQYTGEKRKVIKTVHIDSLLVPEKWDLTLEDHYLFVPVPGNFQEIKQRDLSLAISWRDCTREVFTKYLANGWVVNDLVKDDRTTNQYLYVLEKRL